MKNRAFTLAEVLITLGIIGVVSAMTIPALMNNINDVKFRSQLLKSYSLLQQTIKRMEADDVAITPDSYTNDERANAPLYRKFERYLTNIIDCGQYSTKKGCFNIKSDKYKLFKGDRTVDSQYFDDGQFVLSDGSLVLFEQPMAPKPYIFIWIDVNGIKPPNRLGYDLFCFQLAVDGLLKPMGDIGTKYEGSKYCDKNGSDSWNGMSCSYKAIHNPDYFKWIRK